MFSYEPIEEILIVGDLSWGNVNENETECPHDQKLLHWNITGEVRIHFFRKQTQLPETTSIR